MSGEAIKVPLSVLSLPKSVVSPKGAVVKSDRDRIEDVAIVIRYAPRLTLFHLKRGGLG
ncbi:hypothetical protein EMIT0P265_180037 [Pseudomonas zeae]